MRRLTHGDFDFVVSQLDYFPEGIALWEYHILPKDEYLFSWIYGDNEMASKYYYDNYPEALEEAKLHIDRIKLAVH